MADLCPEATFSKYPNSSDEREYLPIYDGDEFAVEGAKITAVHTPGHTTDHIAFMSDTGDLFTGDSVLGQGTAVFESLVTYIASLKKQLNLNPSTIYPGHGPIVERATEKIQEYITHRQQREDEIVKILADSAEEALVTPRDIVKVIYARYPESLWPAAEKGIILHLEKLKEEGKSREVERGKWALTTRPSR